MRLLQELGRQTTEELFTYSVVVADNDSSQSAKRVVEEFSKNSALNVIYCVESQQNIALARNKALEYAKGDYVAFIDDDEYPVKSWLYSLYSTCNESSADGVLGPVKPFFEYEPPKWAIKGRFFERPTHETGYRLDLSEARTGNVILRKKILEGIEEPFQKKFGTGGEDIDFFRRMMENGCVFVWCKEAIVYETIPPERCTRSYLLRRALLRGRNSLRQRGGRVRKVIESLVAVPVYCMALFFFTGEHHFMKYLIKLCYHAGRLLTLVGLSPVRVRDI